MVWLSSFARAVLAGVCQRMLAGMLFGFLAALSGCLSPIAMHRAVIEYDRTVSYVEADLLLLNIARARHHRPVHFTAVSSVAATFDFRTSAGITGKLGGTAEAFDRPVTLEYSASVAENPTITIVPITGEEFTKRILRPLDEAKFEFLVHQGFDVNMILRLVARGIAIDGEEPPTLLLNAPSKGEAYKEFRRRLLHLAWLDHERKLHVGPIMYEEAIPVKLDRAPHPDEIVDALEKGYRWTSNGEEKSYTLRRQAIGRVVITNYDTSRLPNEERRRLQQEAQRYPADYILVDIRPGFPGGDYPLHGTILLRSLNSIIGFVARGISEEPEYLVEKDPRTGPIPRNPSRTLEIDESGNKPADFEFSVEFDKRHYSIRKYPVSEGMVPSWNQEAFAVLANLFQMTVTDLTRYPTPAITIAK